MTPRYEGMRSAAQRGISRPPTTDDRRISQLYEISKLLSGLLTAEDALNGALTIAADALDLFVKPGACLLNASRGTVVVIDLEAGELIVLGDRRYLRLSGHGYGARTPGTCVASW